MNLLLTAPQCFFLVILISGFIGFQRGWRREVVLLAFVLSAILFLSLNGGPNLSEFVFVRLPVITQLTLSGSAAGPTPPPPTATQVFMTTLVTLIVLIAAGYYVGNKAFPKPAKTSESVLGIIPAIISGYAILAYITKIFATSPLITLGVATPTQTTISNYLLVIFVIAVIAVVVGLVAASVKK